MKQEPRPAIHMEKQLGWGGLSGELQGSPTLLARLMESQICHQPSGLVGEGLEKGQRHLLTLMPDTSASNCYPGAGAQR